MYIRGKNVLEHVLNSFELMNYIANENKETDRIVINTQIRSEKAATGVTLVSTKRGMLIAFGFPVSKQSYLEKKTPFVIGVCGFLSLKKKMPKNLHVVCYTSLHS